jgi:hypothetical protein
MVSALSCDNMAVCSQTHITSRSVPCLVSSWQLVTRLAAVRRIYLVWWEHGSLCADTQQFGVFTSSGVIMAATSPTRCSSWSVPCLVRTWQFVYRIMQFVVCIFSGENMSASAQTHSSSWLVHCLVITWQSVRRLKAVRGCTVCTLSGEIMAVGAQTHSSLYCVLSLVRTVQFVRRLTALRGLCLVWWVHGSLCPDSQQFIVFTLSGENMAACAQTHSSSWSFLRQVWTWQLLRRLTAVRGLYIFWWEHGSLCTDLCSSWCVPSLVKTWQLVRRLTAIRGLCLLWWDHGKLCTDSQQLVVYTISGRGHAVA